MRFLKNKIAQARKADKPIDPEDSPPNPTEKALPEKTQENNTRRLRTRPENLNFSENHSSSRGATSSLNIIKNYSRAMTNFAVSDLSRPYLEKIIDKKGVRMDDFLSFIEERKQSVNCIKKLREMLPSDEEGDEFEGVKSVFQEICILFLKMFSVNWIFSSKVTDKLSHLNCRFKILRRIRNPQHFTYLRSFHDAF